MRLPCTKCTGMRILPFAHGKHRMVLPSNIDFTGLPEEPTKRSLKHQTQSHDTETDDPGEKKTDQDAEDTNLYDLTQGEVIDVDAEHPITNESMFWRVNIGKIVWEKCGSKFGDLCW